MILSAPPRDVLALEHVSKIYSVGTISVPALRDASLEVWPGEFIVILGPSGCGKTTLMNIIGGLDVPTSGRVVIDGEDISTFNEEALTEFRREKVGFVFQFFNLVSTLTARENVQLAADLAHSPRQVDDVLEDVGLLARGDHFPSELSGGEQQRVAIARALVKNAPILLCDEPTGELDFETGRRVLALLHETTHLRGQTVLMVTHNAPVASIADRVLRLRSGEIVSDERNRRPADPMELTW
ncbi:MAG: ABC transporter ATP-binding protein YtrE [Fimbriimonadaceae bacterium]|nr:ABC transporter ATP-binding protein YtrE [Fimbriimonadaceae bacterium]